MSAVDACSDSIASLLSDAPLARLQQGRAEYPGRRMSLKIRDIEDLVGRSCNPWDPDRLWLNVLRAIWGVGAFGFSRRVAARYGVRTSKM